jgi:RHS repeat-associated protein
VPQGLETFQYDADGNLAQDGRWVYSWDAENRLVAMESIGLVPDASKLALTFRYDWQGRRIAKVVYTNYNGEYVPSYTNRFVYDGWNLMATLNSEFSTLNSFVWGLDLSGSLQGAGGIGGLLFIHDCVSAIGYCPAYDGNGNVTALVDAATGTVVATCEYGPFGELLRATGPMAKANPLRFSTKCQDEETDLLYYGYRYYNADTGRWGGRDPLEERGGRNLYALAGNNTVNTFDTDGREIASICPICGQYYVGQCPRDGYPRTGAPPELSCGGSCSGFPDVVRAVKVANDAMKQGGCAKWFKEHGGDAANYSVNCHGKCKLVCLFGGTAWTYPGFNRIGVCPGNLTRWGASGIAALLIHEAAHHYCPPLGLGGEACANAAEAACEAYVHN